MIVHQVEDFRVEHLGLENHAQGFVTLVELDDIAHFHHAAVENNQATEHVRRPGTLG